MGIDTWLIPKIIGKDGVTVREIETESGCKIDVSKAESTVTIQGESPEVAAQGKKAVYKLIEQARKENIFISIPDSAMSAFIGRGGDNVRKLSAKYKVKIERLKKEMSTIQIKGNVQSVELAAASVYKWLSDWESANEGIKLDVDESIFRPIVGKLNSIQKETGTKIDMNRRNGNLTIRGGNDVSRNHALTKIKSLITMENEKADMKKIEMNESKGNMLSDKDAGKSVPEPEIPTPKVSQRCSEYPSTPVGYTENKKTMTATKKRETPQDPKQKKSNGVSKKASEASKNLYNMLISDPVKDCDSSTISSNDIEDDSTNERSVPVQKARVYKSTSGFSVRV